MRNLGLDPAVIERCRERLARTERMLKRRYGTVKQASS